MAIKKIKIKGIDASYQDYDPDIDALDIPERYKREYREQVASGFRFLGGPPKTPRRAWEDDKALKAKFRAQEQAARDAEQAVQDARNRAQADYQGSLNKPSGYPDLPAPAGDGQVTFDKILAVLFVGAVILVLILR